MSNVLGFTVFENSCEALTDEVLATLRSCATPRWLACFNPHSYAVTKEDGVFAQSLRAADWLVADGIRVVAAARFGNGHDVTRITGFDVFTSISSACEKEGGVSAFFLGSSPEVLRLIHEKHRSEFGGLRWAGAYSPPYVSDFTLEENERIIRLINNSNADVLWVGMTAPKQEKWINENLGRLNIKFAGAIGAVFDFYAGTVVRPSPAFQRIGLEWLVRFLREPRRLWRRTVISAPVFFTDVLKQKARAVVSDLRSRN